MKNPPHPIHSSVDGLRYFQVHRANSLRPLIPIDHETLHALIANHSSQPDFESKLLQETLSFDYSRSPLLGRYGELYSNSPIPTHFVSAEELLRHLYRPGESVVVVESSASIEPPCLWEKRTSPSLSPAMSSFWPLSVNPEAVQLLRAGAILNTPRNAALITLGHRYAASTFQGDDVATRFPDIIAGRWPVVAVASSGDMETNILFRIDAASYGAWRVQAKRIIGVFSAELLAAHARLTDAFPLPSLHRRQRLVYLAPA